MGLLAATIRLLTNARALDVSIVDGNGDQITSFSTAPPTPPSTASLTSVATSNVSVSLLAANTNRKQVYIYNDASKVLFVAFASTASPTAFSVLIPSNSFWAGSLDGYTGEISGVLSSGAGNARITEITV